MSVTESGRLAAHAAATVPAAGGAVSAAADLAGLTAAPTRRWGAVHRSLLAALDGVLILVSVACACLARAHFIRPEPAAGAEIANYLAVALVLSAGWMLSLAARGCYELRFLGVGAEELKRLISATLWAFGLLAIASYALKFVLPRGFVALALPLGLVLLVGGRFAARRWLIFQRGRGRYLHRVIAVGDRGAVSQLADQLRTAPYAGLRVVGVCVPQGSAGGATVDGVPVVGDLADVRAATLSTGADTVAVAASPAVPAQRLREIAWQLEGSNVDLIVAPALTDVAGPRITVRPVAGLALLHVDQPVFRGWPRMVKWLTDRLGAMLGLVLLSPVLLTIAMAVRMTTPGPALFRQPRVGKDGRTFTMLKFRSMHRDAGQRLAPLQALNERDGLLFKIKKDPRVTRLGAVLRRTSLDELPQLVNVLRGEMSLVGPRPLPVDDDAFQGAVRRRLLVPPGITGLWQVSGRSDLSWEDSVRLDLYYVENWSVALDFLILARTVLTVLRGGGAY